MWQTRTKLPPNGLGTTNNAIAVTAASMAPQRTIRLSVTSGEQREGDDRRREVKAAVREPTGFAEQQRDRHERCHRGERDRRRLASPGHQRDSGGGDRKEHTRHRAGERCHQRCRERDREVAAPPREDSAQCDRQSERERRPTDDRVDHDRDREHVVGDRRRGCEFTRESREAVRRDQRTEGDDPEGPEPRHQRGSDDAVGRSGVPRVPEVVPCRDAGSFPQQGAHEVGRIVRAAHAGDPDDGDRRGHDGARTPIGDVRGRGRRRTLRRLDALGGDGVNGGGGERGHRGHRHRAGVPPACDQGPESMALSPGTRPGTSPATHVAIHLYSFRILCREDANRPPGEAPGGRCRPRPI